MPSHLDSSLQGREGRQLGVNLESYRFTSLLLSPGPKWKTQQVQATCSFLVQQRGHKDEISPLAKCTFNRIATLIKEREHPVSQKYSSLNSIHSPLFHSSLLLQRGGWIPRSLIKSSGEFKSLHMAMACWLALGKVLTKCGPRSPCPPASVAQLPQKSGFIFNEQC